jgi:hypothetical protein
MEHCVLRSVAIALFLVLLAILFASWIVFLWNFEKYVLRDTSKRHLFYIGAAFPILLPGSPQDLKTRYFIAVAIYFVWAAFLFFLMNCLRFLV